MESTSPYHESAYELVAEDLATENVHLQDRILSLEADVINYRELAQSTLHALHALTLKHAQQTNRLRELSQEYRQFRARMLQQDERRAAA
jgi:hypothetical protein